LITLQSKRVVKAEELAKKFAISKRTVYRDIRVLEEGGIPIGAEAGIGYYLIDGYQLPPVMFSMEEARALLVGGKLLSKLTDARVNESFESALTKIRAVLDRQKKEALEDLEEHLLIEPFSNGFYRQPANPVLHEIEQALTSNLELEMDYYSNYNGNTSRRVVEPIGLCYYYHQWHMFAYCQLREGYRDFRVDRMSKVKVLDKHFKKHKHPSLQQYIDSIVQDTELIEATIVVANEANRYMQDQKYHMGLIAEERGEKTTTMHFTIVSLEFFARWLLMYGNNINIIAPEALKLKCQTLVRELSDTHL